MRTLKGRLDGTQGMAAWSPGNPRGNKTPLPNVELCRAMQGYVWQSRVNSQDEISRIRKWKLYINT